MKSYKNLFIVFALILLNSILFAKVDLISFQTLQVFLAIFGIVTLSFIFINLESEPYFKKYSIPLYVTFFIGMRNTESVISKYLERNFAEFYNVNKTLIYIGLLVVFLAIIYLYYNKNKKRTIET